MQRFTALYTALDETNRTNEKVAALVEYFANAPAEDAAWALYFLTGRRLNRVISSTVLAYLGCRRQRTASLVGRRMLQRRGRHCRNAGTASARHIERNRLALARS